jgi:hypothetical protein
LEFGRFLAKGVGVRKTEICICFVLNCFICFRKESCFRFNTCQTQAHQRIKMTSTVRKFALDQFTMVEEAFKQAVETKASALFIVTSGVDAETGQLWCPDCRVGVPLLLSKAKEHHFAGDVFECEVGERLQWRSGGNPYRMSKIINAQKIPTAILIRNGAVVGQLGDADSQNPGKVDSLLQE